MPIPWPPTSDPLFDADDLGNWLGRPGTIDQDKAEVVEQVVWGWLKAPLGWDERPDPVTAEVYSWAIELGAIAHENPAGLSSQQLGPAQQAFSSERRAEILQIVAFAGGATSSLRPRGSFPAASTYPDPATSYRW